MPQAIVLVVVFLALVLANAIFVAVEFSFLTVDRNVVRRRQDEGDKTAKLVESSLKKTSTNLSGAQLGITVTSLIAGFLVAPSFGYLLQEALGLTDLSQATVTGVGTTLAFIIATATQMVFGELVPKNWAIATPLLVAKLVVWPQRIFMFVFGWLVYLLNSSANWVLRRLGFQPEEEVANARTAEELAAVVNRSAREGTLEKDTAELVERTIEFGDHTAADVMRPRPQVWFLDDDQTVQEVLETSIKSGFSRFPVMGENVDDIVGIIHFKHALAVSTDQRTTRTVGEIMHDVAVASESQSLDPLLRQLRETPLQFAVVVDEYGGTSGVVTLEDLIEEIVGEIEDEQDFEEIRPSLRADGTHVVSGLLRPDELGDLIDLEMPEGEESDTIGGLIGEVIDRLPDVGDQVILEAIDEEHRDEDGLPTRCKVRMRVVQMDGHRVDLVEVHRLPDDDDSEVDSIGERTGAARSAPSPLSPSSAPSPATAASPEFGGGTSR